MSFLQLLCNIEDMIGLWSHCSCHRKLCFKPTWLLGQYFIHLLINLPCIQDWHQLTHSLSLWAYTPWRQKICFHCTKVSSMWICIVHVFTHMKDSFLAFCLAFRGLWIWSHLFIYGSQICMPQLTVVNYWYIGTMIVWVIFCLSYTFRSVLACPIAKW